MEGSNEPLLNAKAEVSLVREGAGEAGFWSEKDHSLNCVFLLPFQVTNQVSEWQLRPVLSPPPRVRGGRQDLVLLPLWEARTPGHPEPSEARPQFQGLCP